MFYKDKNLMHELLTMVNSAYHESNDTVVARALLENRENIAHTSMDMISKKYYVSQASITRFIKKIGYDDYRSFREAMVYSQEYMRFRYEHPEYADVNAVIRGVDEDVQRVTDGMKGIDPAVFCRIADLFLEYDNIWFFGSEMTMAMMRLLQLRLEAIGKNCYTLNQLPNQIETLNKLGPDTLAVAVITNDRWIKAVGTEMFAASKAYTVLLSPEDTDYTAEHFDEVLEYGINTRNDLAFYQLTYLVQILARMV